ncbi:predicted protein [Naegleria gruberi]|uniref:Predicted protein n=1 Tax=Naegleria gruberi TaxID=5762 RepID=D2VNR3_NAEGR|nr:uncharacterized protein NAEGRDRAFT_70590 [Naegleria gruberi]EFC41457.1 predicted protein [Naegleria gruberi]|eukprot:XP_002674201.1 predicted protein [Naegleria gruberi strain NEG-M]
MENQKVARGNLLAKIAREQCRTIYLDFSINTLENEVDQRALPDDDLIGDEDDGFVTVSDEEEDIQHQHQQQTSEAPIVMTSLINDDVAQRIVTISTSSTASPNHVYHYEYGILGEDSHTQSVLYKNRLYCINIKYEYIGVHSLLDPVMEQPMISMPTLYQSTEGLIVPDEVNLIPKLSHLQSRMGETDFALSDGNTMSNHVMSTYIKTGLFSGQNPPLDFKRVHALFKAVCMDEKLGFVYTYGGADFNVVPRQVSRNFLILDLERLAYVQLPIPVNVDNESEQLVPMEGHTMIKRHDKIYILGGNTNGSEFMKSLYEIDVSEVDKFCLDLRRRDFGTEPMSDMIIPVPKFRKIIAKNHDIISTRSYHTCEYIPKYDIMVSVAGKVRKGIDAPMLNEILIYHFNRNEFQVIGDHNILNPWLKVKDLPYAHVLGSTRIYGYDSFSTFDNCYQMAYYGGCSTTDYDSDQSYDPHLYILSFKPSKREVSNVDVLVTKVNLKERASSGYTAINYHPETSSFYLFGSFQAQSRDELSIFTMKFASTIPVLKQFPKLSLQSSYSDISFTTLE